MSNQKLVVGIVVALFMFAAVNVQAESVILQELGGSVNQGPSYWTNIFAETTNGNATVILNGLMDNQALMLGSTGTGPVPLGDPARTVITQDTKGFMVDQGPRPMGFDVDMRATVTNRGNATVGGGFNNSNILNSVVATAPSTSTLEINQTVNYPNTIRQGMEQNALAIANIGTASANNMNQKISNVVNLAISQSAGTGVSVIQDAGKTLDPPTAPPGIQQGGTNRVRAETVTGEAIVTGAQGVSNIINLAGAKGGLTVTQDFNANGLSVNSPTWQNGYNVASAYSAQQRPIPNGGDPAITMQQNVLNSVNRVELVKETGPAFLWGSQTYTDVNSIENPDTSGVNRMYVTMATNGIGNVSASGSQVVSALANTALIGKGGTGPADDGLASSFTQASTGPVYMNDYNRSSNRVVALATTGNASSNVAQSVNASLNTIVAIGPLYGDFTQITGGATEQAFRNRVEAETVRGNATIQGSQSIINSINVIQGSNGN